MAAIKISSPADTPLEHARDVVSEDMAARLSDGELRALTRWYHPGGESELQMFEVTVQPNDSIDQHAHDEDEIIYVLDGELHLGSRVLTEGSSVAIRAHTLYSFRAGPNGLRFLNFRARQDMSYITKDEFMARRKGSDVAAAPA